jgi:hypothetical protein
MRADALFCRVCGSASEPARSGRRGASSPLAAMAGAGVGSAAALAVFPGLPIWAGLASGLVAAVLVWAAGLVLMLGLPCPQAASRRAGRFLQLDALEAVGRMRVVLAPRPSFRGPSSEAEGAVRTPASFRAA